MKRLLCIILALLLTHSDKSNNSIKYYVGITFQDQSYYHEYMNGPYLELVIRDFVTDSSIESVFITRDLYVRQTDND